jgi:hypothetical protein
VIYAIIPLTQQNRPLMLAQSERLVAVLIFTKTKGTMKTFTLQWSRWMLPPLLYFALFLVTGCQKEPMALQSVEQNVATVSSLKPFTVESTEDISSFSELIIRLKTRSDIKSLGHLNFDKATLIKVNEDKALQLISIPTDDQNKTVQVFYSVIKDGFFVTVFERVGTWNKKSQFTGINFLRAQGIDILAERFIDNQAIGTEIDKNSGSARLIPNPDTDTCLKCINRNYQLMKIECEKDFICDIACTVSPCFALWVITALANCTSGCCAGEPCNPFT